MNKILVTFTDGMNTWDREMTKEEVLLIADLKPILESESGDKIYRVESFHFNLHEGNFAFMIKEVSV